MNKLIVMLAALILTASSVYAGTCDEVRRVGHFLPQYCHDRCEDGDGKKWDRIFGVNTFLHVHHYCFGLAAEAELRLDEAAGEFTYVIKSWPDYSKLKPIALYKKARILDLFSDQVSDRWGKQTDAISLYEKAIRLDPTYTAAYAALSENAARRGDFDNAKNYLNQGLKLNPKSDLLKKRLRELQKQSTQ